MTDKDSFRAITVSEIRAVTLIRQAPDTKITIARRAGSAFSVKKAGRTVYEQNGKKTVSDASHIVFLPAGAQYQLHVEEAGDCILFEVEFCGEPPFSEITAICTDSSAELYGNAERAESAWTYKKQGFRHICLSCLYAILARYHSGEAPYVPSSKLQLIEPAIRCMEEHLADPDLNTERLAELCAVSVPYFRKLFCEIYRMPPAKYIESVRIGKAKDMLRSDYSSVGEIAESVGYRNIYHFSRVFKKCTGLPPGEYARRHGR